MPAAKKIPAAAFAAAWCNDDTTIAGIAQAFGMCIDTARRAAQTMGLPRRPKGRRIKIDRDLLAEMWAACVRLDDMSVELGMSIGGIRHAVEDMKLPRRTRGRHEVITRHEFKMRRFMAQMAKTAAREQSAMINAEMADGVTVGGRLVGQTKARDAAW